MTETAIIRQYVASSQLITPSPPQCLEVWCQSDLAKRNKTFFFFFQYIAIINMSLPVCQSKPLKQPTVAKKKNNLTRAHARYLNPLSTSLSRRRQFQIRSHLAGEGGTIHKLSHKSAFTKRQKAPFFQPCDFPLRRSHP